MKRFNNSVFEPAESIKKGRMKDVFNSIRMDEALAQLIKELVVRTGINPHERY